MYGRSSTGASRSIHVEVPTGRYWNCTSATSVSSLSASMKRSVSNSSPFGGVTITARGGPVSTVASSSFDGSLKLPASSIACTT